ncbi:MAG: immunity 63 family protein [Idiomarina sp.]|nr:immunity 63 family protein [Idiomarina sp.]
MRQAPERYEIIQKLKLHLEKVGIDIGETEFLQNDFAEPYFDVDEFGFNYYIKDRDKFIKYAQNLSEDEILYLLVKNFVESEAVEYEFKNRVDEKDFRRLYFDRAMYLMEKIDSKWGKKLRKEFDIVLRNNPFRDI